MLNILKYSFRLLLRDWRAGELRVLFIAIALAVASVTSVGFFTDRVAQTLRQQANELLAADLVVSADRELRAVFLDEARARQLRTVEIRQLRSMVLAGELSQLVELKAVAPGYPLRGQLRVAAPQGGEVRVADIPRPGTVWVEADLLRRLQLKVGDSITLGAAQFKLAEVITYEPDRGGNMFSIAPRVLLRSDDLAATQLLQEGSRAQYQLLVADACSGLHSMFSLTAMGLLYLYLMRHTSVPRNLIIMAAILPIAFIANIVRVMVLILVTYHLGNEAGQGFLHGFAGIMLFVIGLLFLFALDGILGFIFSDHASKHNSNA